MRGPAIEIRSLVGPGCGGAVSTRGPWRPRPVRNAADAIRVFLPSGPPRFHPPARHGALSAPKAHGKSCIWEPPIIPSAIGGCAACLASPYQQADRTVRTGAVQRQQPSWTARYDVANGPVNGEGMISLRARYAVGNRLRVAISHSHFDHIGQIDQVQGSTLAGQPEGKGRDVPLGWVWAIYPTPLRRPSPNVQPDGATWSFGTICVVRERRS